MVYTWSAAASKFERFASCYEFVGPKVTNNVAEYRGLLAGLKIILKEPKIESVHVEGDSKLVLEQVFGTWKVKAPGLKSLHAECKSLTKTMKCTYAHIPRADNAEADGLANKAMDTKGSEILVHGAPEQHPDSGKRQAEEPAVAMSTKRRAVEHINPLLSSCFCGRPDDFIDEQGQHHCTFIGLCMCVHCLTKWTEQAYRPCQPVPCPGCSNPTEAYHREKTSPLK